MALPTDKLEVVLDQFESFGVGQCQCRMAMQVLGRGCGKPLENCTVMGQWAERGIEAGRRCAASPRKKPWRSNARPNRTGWSTGS